MTKINGIMTSAARIVRYILFISSVEITYTFIFILWMMGLYALRVGVSTVFWSKVVEKGGIKSV